MSQLISTAKYVKNKLAIEDEVYFGDDGVLYKGRKDGLIEPYLKVQSSISNGIQSINGITEAIQLFNNDINIQIASSGDTHSIQWMGVLAVSRGGTGLNTLGSPLQYLRVNSFGDALEYATAPGGDNWGTQVVQHSVELSGDGTTISPLRIAQQGATIGQVLKWDGAKWYPADDNTGGGITSINALTASTQTLSTGTGGSDFNIASSGSTHTFNLPFASASNTGKLSSTDWTTFNNKVPPSRQINTAGLLSGGGDLSTDRTITTNINTNRLVGRTSAGAGVMEEIQVGSNLLLTSNKLSAIIPSETQPLFLDQYNAAPTMIGTGSISSGTALNAIWSFVPRLFPTGTKIKELALRIQSNATTAPTGFRMGLYKAEYNVSTGQYLPKDLVIDSGYINVPTAATGIFAYVLPTAIEVDGYCYLCYRFDTYVGGSLTIAMFPNVAATSVYLPLWMVYGGTSGTAGNKGIWITYSTSIPSVTSPLPSVWSGSGLAIGVSNIPALFFKPI